MQQLTYHVTCITVSAGGYSAEAQTMLIMINDYQYSSIFPIYYLPQKQCTTLMIIIISTHHIFYLILAQTECAIKCLRRFCRKLFLFTFEQLILMWEHKVGGVKIFPIRLRAKQMIYKKKTFPIRDCLLFVFWGW